ncbi:uncharacterized protein [Montipora foliosa]|uniref:uncharacterized protein n=1 Tax=Montipora foliosa TaxID=591990 RepID=UPI0035F1EF12
MATHSRRKGQRDQRPTEREMNLPWRNPSPRSNSPVLPVVNGSTYSPHAVRKREPSSNPVDLEHKKNVDFLRREWQKFEKERSRCQDTVTDLVIRDEEVTGFQRFDLDAFLENLLQGQQCQK